MKDSSIKKLEDIAGRCGVSVSTVSRVMNGDPRISMETRRRVMEAADGAHFSARRSRRHLSRATIRLTVVVPESGQMGENIFFDMNELLLSLKEAFTDGRIHVETITRDTLHDPGFPLGNADGIIIAFSDLEQETQDRLQNSNIPFVFLNRTVDDGNYVSCNNFRGMMALGYHIHGRGLRTTGYLACPTIPVNIDRFRGYRLFMTETRGAKDGSLVKEVDSLDGVTGKTASFFIERACDSVMCFNDNFAIRLIGEFQKMGIAVPGDISVTGFDDSPARRIFRPLITTINLSTYDMGFFASRWLRDVIYNRTIRPLRLEIDGAIIEGDSVITGGIAHEK